MNTRNLATALWVAGLVAAATTPPPAPKPAPRKSRA